MVSLSHRQAQPQNTQVTSSFVKYSTCTHVHAHMYWCAEGSELSSGCCRLSNNRSVPVNSNPERRSRTKCDRSLVLFVFLEDTAASRNTGAVGHCTTHYWEQQMDRVCELREMLDGLLQSQQKKFKQATHSVLNKLLCNYGTHIKVTTCRVSYSPDLHVSMCRHVCVCVSVFVCLQTASVLHSTLPQLADAVASIIGNSSNDHFKQRCRNMLQVSNTNYVYRSAISSSVHFRYRMRQRKRAFLRSCGRLLRSSFTSLKPKQLFHK